MQVLPAKKIGNFIIAGKLIDVQADKQEKKPPKNDKDLQTIGIASGIKMCGKLAQNG